MACFTKKHNFRFTISIVLLFVIVNLQDKVLHNEFYSPTKRHDIAVKTMVVSKHNQEKFTPEQNNTI